MMLSRVYAAAWWDAGSDNLLNSMDQSPDIYIDPYNRVGYEEASVGKYAHIYVFTRLLGTYAEQWKDSFLL